MIINNARGSHVSPGVYTKEVDVNYSVKSLGITSLGLVGETLKGPAFEPIKVESPADFENYFGSTSVEKYKGTGLPKYELPYIAKEYLKESRELYVCRVLGLSGYDAGKAWVIKAQLSGAVSAENATYAIAVLRSKGKYNVASGTTCEAGSGDTLNFFVTGVEVGPYIETAYDANCNEITPDTGSTSTASTITTDNMGKFSLKVTTQEDGSAKTYTYQISLNYGDSNYIFNVLGSDPLYGSAPIFVEEVYDYAIKDMVEKIAEDSGATFEIVTGALTAEENLADYHSTFRYAETPWLVSEAHSNMSADNSGVSVTRLFKAITLSDGNNANTEVKISIQNIRPDKGTFDLVVRPMYDNDVNPVVLEKFSGCDLVRGSKNYVALRVGTANGDYELKSKYIALIMADDESQIANSVPCGFEGYPLHKFSQDDVKNMPIGYNTVFNYDVKAKRQYFGFSTTKGVDVDILKFKGGLSAETEISNGFHLDAIIEQFDNQVSVNGEEPVEFTCVDGRTYMPTSGVKIPRILTEAYMANTLYADVNTRKFTVCFFGGFDGWDIYREQRTNTDDFKASKYVGATYQKTTFPGLPINAIDSDYYAYLAAYRQFANPEGIDINIFATPGIDWQNNELLVEDALSVIEDDEDGRGGDALYIIDSPNRDANASDAQEDMYTPDEVAELLDSTSIDSSYAATYWPWVKCFDSANNVYINLPVTKDVVRNLAHVDNTAKPWFAPAGINRGNVSCVRATMKTKLTEEDTLYENRINPVKTFAVDGVKIWGNKTLYRSDSPLNRVNVRRLMIRVKKLITTRAKDLIFDQFDNSLKDQFMGLVNPILADVQANGGIYDYRILIDDSVEARDAHTLPCTIKIKPTPTLEYIDLTFTIYPESVDFEN